MELQEKQGYFHQPHIKGTLNLEYRSSVQLFDLITKVEQFRCASLKHPKAAENMYPPGTFQDRLLQLGRWRPQLRPPAPSHPGISRWSSPEAPLHSWGRTWLCRPSRRWQSESRYPPWTARGNWPPRTTPPSPVPCKTGWCSGCVPAHLRV